MRAILTLLVLAVVVAIVLIMTGVIDIDQTEQAALPELDGGQLPEFDVDAPEVDIGTETREVEVPTIDVQSADEAEAEEAAANGQ